MKYLERNEALRQWDTYWDETQHEFFKVESLQDYSAEEVTQSPSYQLWMAGDKQGARDLLVKQRKTGASGVALTKNLLKRRIHIIEEPLSSYLQWEIMHYKQINMPLGKEQVFLVAKESINDVDIPGDFMIFDNTRAVQSHYSPSGRMTGMDFYDKGDDISRFLAIKERLLADGVAIDPI
jgi:hypothetical protein